MLLGLFIFSVCITLFLSIFSPDYWIAIRWAVCLCPRMVLHPFYSPVWFLVVVVCLFVFCFYWLWYPKRTHLAVFVASQKINGFFFFSLSMRKISCVLLCNVHNSIKYVISLFFFFGGGAFFKGLQCKFDPNVQHLTNLQVGKSVRTWKCLLLWLSATEVSVVKRLFLGIDSKQNKASLHSSQVLTMNQCFLTM